MRLKQILWSVLFWGGIAESILASYDTTGDDGIRSRGLGLTGAGVAIGLVDPVGRPGKQGYDTLTNLYHPLVSPTGVYYGRLDSSMNSDISSHGTETAGVIIAGGPSDGSLYGVSPQAELHAGTPAISFDSFADMASAMDSIAKRAGGQVRAINLSWGAGLEGFETTNGNSFFSLFVDWSAKKHDVLYVTGLTEFGLDVPTPGDNFNGITVASSEYDAEVLLDLRYKLVSPINDFYLDPAGGRVAVDLLAPGVGVLVPSNGGGSINTDGNSYAVPHVVGAVALLQELAVQQAGASTPGFQTGNHERHEVMKAVLLNSADKIDGVHGSNRTILDLNGNDWYSSPAYMFPSVSLDEQMGAGHLNARSAKIQFETGEYNPGNVPLIGWDLGEIGGVGSRTEYRFEISSGFFAATLAWDRHVALTNPDDEYDYGDQFFPYSDIDQVLTNLDLYLLPASTDSLNAAIEWSSAFGDSVEHIFWNVETPGEYKLVVVNNGGLGEPEEYGLAWWFGEAPTPGDFDDDGDVDGADFLTWQRNPGVGNLSDWRSNYGASLVAASHAVPEPSPLIMLAFGLATVFFHRRTVPIT